MQKNNATLTAETKNQEYIEEDEFNLSLAAMEQEIKPQVISTINILCKDYTKLIKSQNDKLSCALNAQAIFTPKRKKLSKSSK